MEADGPKYEISVSEITTNDVVLDKYCTLDTVDPAELTKVSEGVWVLAPPTKVSVIRCECDIYHGGCYH